MSKKLIGMYIFVLFVFVLSACFKFNILSVKYKEAKTAVNFYTEMYNDVLSNLMAPNHFMLQSQPGDFLGDWTGDAGAFAPHVLFINGYTTEAKQVMDYVRTLELSQTDIKTRMSSYPHNKFRSPTGSLTPYRTSNIVDFVVGFGCYYNGPAYYSEACNWCSAIGVGLAGGSIAVSADPNPIGDINGYIAGLASVANTAFVGANACLNPNYLNTGLTLLNKLNDTYWNVTKGYYVDTNSSHQGTVEFSAFQNGSALWALTWAYGIRKDATILSKISSLYEKSMLYLWDSNRGGYYDFKADVVLGKDLGANLLWCRGLLWAYWVTGDVRYLTTAEQVLNFIQNDLLINDTAHPGYKILAHDYFESRGASSNYCTGCNFLAMECIWLYNNLKTNGPLNGNIPVSSNPGCSSKIAN